MANISHFTQTVNGVSTTYDIHDANALTTEIDSMGTDWVRFKCGLQICYGTVTSNSNVNTGISRFSFPIAFAATPVLVVTPSLDGQWLMTSKVESTTSWILNAFGAWDTPPAYNNLPAIATYVAIGKWN